MQIAANTQALIFDMDGTLVDSEPVGPQTFIEIARKYEIEPSDEENNTFVQSWRRIGNYVDEKEMLSKFVISHNIGIAPEDFVQNFFETYLLNLTKAPAITGADDFLKQAKQKGYKLAIVSASKIEQIKTVLRNHNWQDVFDFIVGEEDITKHKPDPEGYLKAIDRIGLPANNCIIFEDAKNGTIAAKATGAYVVGLRKGNSETIDLSAANIILNNYSEIYF